MAFLIKSGEQFRYLYVIIQLRNYCMDMFVVTCFLQKDADLNGNFTLY